jgi:hypothetical protein
MNPVTAVFNYKTETEGNYTKFIYKKSPFSFKMVGPLCFFTAIPAILITLNSNPESLISGLIAWLIWMMALAIVLLLLLNFLRQQGEFKISNGEIVADGKTYGRDHVSNYFIKTPSGTISSSTVIITANPSRSLSGNISNLSAGAVGVAHETGQAIRKYMREVNYKICIRYGSNDIVIAKGLNEKDSDVLFDRIVEVAGLQKN